MRLSDDLEWFIVDDELRLPVRWLDVVDHVPPLVRPELRDDDSGMWPWRDRRIRCTVGSYEFSIVWGSGTYSSNYPLMLRRGAPGEFTETPGNVEVMIFESDGVHTFEGEPIGHVDAEQLRALVEGFAHELSDDELHALRREL